jgi:hypothetical protein
MKFKRYPSLIPFEGEFLSFKLEFSIDFIGLTGTGLVWIK